MRVRVFEHIPLKHNSGARGVEGSRMLRFRGCRQPQQDASGRSTCSGTSGLPTTRPRPESKAKSSVILSAPLQQPARPQQAQSMLSLASSDHKSRKARNIGSFTLLRRNLIHKPSGFMWASKSAIPTYRGFRARGFL